MLQVPPDPELFFFRVCCPHKKGKWEFVSFFYLDRTNQVQKRKKKKMSLVRCLFTGVKAVCVRREGFQGVSETWKNLKVRKAPGQNDY